MIRQDDVSSSPVTQQKDVSVAYLETMSREQSYDTNDPSYFTDPETMYADTDFHKSCTDAVTMVPLKDFSRYVSTLLDRLGYSYDMVKYRQQMASERDALYNRHKQLACTRVTTGGKGEGTAMYYESDSDFMYVAIDVICADNPLEFIEKRNITVLQTERQETSPGYTRVKLLKMEGNSFIPEIKQSLFRSESESNCVSSQSFSDAMESDIKENKLGRDIAVGDASGPSTPTSYLKIRTDNVFSFRCYCPGLLTPWVQRNRIHGWPSPDTIHKISLLDGHVVPVGFKGSENAFREWRICYSLAELHLMRNLNETQVKLYILLKKVCKSVLNPVCKDMTSYIMKNVVFWECEARGLDNFDPDVLMNRLFDSLSYLQTCIVANNLPSYMIPERNLLAGRLDSQKRQELTRLLSHLLNEGTRMILRCESLREAMIVMHMTPSKVKEYGEKRDKLETLVLIDDAVLLEEMRPGMSEEEIARIRMKNPRLRDITAQITKLLKLDTKFLRRMEKKSLTEIEGVLQIMVADLLS